MANEQWTPNIQVAFAWLMALLEGFAAIYFFVTTNGDDVWIIFAVACLVLSLMGIRAGYEDRENGE